MLDEVALWLGRLVVLLPAIKELWEAARAPTQDPRGELEASMRLVRAIKDRQAREEIGGA